MSTTATARSVGSSLRSLSSTHASSSLACARTIIPGSRTYAQTAFKERPPPRHQNPNTSFRTFDVLLPRYRAVYSPPNTKLKETDFRPPESFTEKEKKQGLDSRVPAHFAEYLNQLFAPLEFPPELAQRVLTHNSHVLSRRGHNASLSFTGRRVLSAYLHFFLLGCPNWDPSHDIELITANALHTNLLGQHVAHEWGVGRVMIWQPAAPDNLDKKSAKVIRSTGLYKVSGEAVQAMFGAIYNQFGGAVALQIFHTKLLPLLLVPGGLPKLFRENVRKMSEKMGGHAVPEVERKVEEVQKEIQEDTVSKVEEVKPRTRRIQGRKVEQST